MVFVAVEVDALATADDAIVVAVTSGVPPAARGPTRPTITSAERRELTTGNCPPAARLEQEREPERQEQYARVAHAG